MDELIWKQDAVEIAMKYCPDDDGSVGKDGDLRDLLDELENLPPVQPTITHEQAVDYLHETGWLQNHDRILTESKIISAVQLETPNNQTHLCVGCNYIYPECPATEADVVFGNGTGNDNICMCACFKPKEPKHGKWIRDGWNYYCSECKRRAHIDYNKWDVFSPGVIVLSDFCPHCGADMRGY